MAESEAVHPVVMQVAIQAALAAVMVLQEAVSGSTSGPNMVNSGEAHKHRYGRPALRKAFFNYFAPVRYAELLSFEMGVTNILQTNTCKLTKEEKVSIVKNWLGREGLQLIQIFNNSEKEVSKSAERMFTRLG